MTDTLDWTPGTILTSAHAEFLMKRGACRGALRYIGWTVDQSARDDPWAALKYAADKLTPERLDACAQARPWVALKYAADKLTPERLLWCEAMT